MKVTNSMISKWARAALLIIFGIILMMYIEAVIEEVSLLLPLGDGGGEGSMILMLLRALFWVVALWCIVSAALNIITSFREPRLSLDDLGAKIDELQRLIVERPAPTQPPVRKPIVVEQAKVEVEKPAAPEEVPPPPP